MDIKNFEFKARVEGLSEYESKLQKLSPRYAGTDFQTDTYFTVEQGRLKLREGNIENSLIYYEREDVAETKLSKIILYKHKPDAALKAILCTQFSVLVVVKKKRKIYFVDHVKFHLDEVDGPGTFLEVEVIDATDKYSTEELKEKCDYFLQYFRVTTNSIEKKSYSDMMLEQISS